MTKEKLYETIGDINQKHIIEAKQVKKVRKPVWLKWGAVAACLALVLSVSIRLIPNSNLTDEQPEPPVIIISESASSSIANDQPESPTLTISESTSGAIVDDQPELPMLTISEHSSGSMGFAGYMAYDVSELVNANPWNENLELSTLPVYENPLTHDEHYIVSGGDFDKMLEFLLEVAGRLGLDTNNLTITDDVPGEEVIQKIGSELQIEEDTISEGYYAPTKLITEAEGVKIEVAQTMTATISFEPAVSLPDEYNFADYASYDDNAAVAEYLKNEYKDFIGIDNPQVNIYGGDYNIYEQQQYHIEFFDASGSEREQIINYNFNRVAFYGDPEEGKLFLARIYQPDLSVKVGDYPIINLEQAYELLSKGNYLTTVPYEMAGLEYVKKVELVYRIDELAEYYLPYYRFYVELPEEEEENGMKTYGLYYVPAVDGAYISNMPVSDMNFNG